MREVGLLLGLLESLEFPLVGGELLSDGLGLAGLELEGLLPEGELGAVLGVELLEAGSVLEGGLQSSSVLLVDDRQGTGDRLPHHLSLDSEARPSAPSHPPRPRNTSPLPRLIPIRQCYQMATVSRARGSSREAWKRAKQRAGGEEKEFGLL